MEESKDEGGETDDTTRDQDSTSGRGYPSSTETADNTAWGGAALGSAGMSGDRGADGLRGGGRVRSNGATIAVEIGTSGGTDAENSNPAEKQTTPDQGAGE